MAGVIIWIISGIACGIIAKEKNRNVIGWTVAGFAFGIFALIVAAIISSEENEDSGNPVTTDSGHQTRTAGRRNSEQKPTKSESSQSDNNIFCPNCGTEIAANSNFCISCGNSLG